MRCAQAPLLQWRPNSILGDAYSILFSPSSSKIDQLVNILRIMDVTIREEGYKYGKRKTNLAVAGLEL